MISRFYIVIAMLGFVLAGCSPEMPKAPAAAPSKPQLMEPFKYHKLIEVAPGDYFDILSWGRGAGVNEGSFIILRSDSANKKFSTTTGDLDGAIANVYNADMDVDGNPEILIETATKDTINYNSIYAYEFTDGKSQKLDFPKLSSNFKKGYHGNDSFYIKEGRLIREFPLYDGNSKTAKPTGEKRTLEYSLRSSNFSVKELSRDTTKAVATKPVPIVKPKQQDKPTEKKSSHHETHHKKKKKHHRHSEG